MAVDGRRLRRVRGYEPGDLAGFDLRRVHSHGGTCGCVVSGGLRLLLLGLPPRVEQLAQLASRSDTVWFTRLERTVDEAGE